MNTRNYVILKSSKNGIQLELDPAVPFNTILDETAKRFREGKGFFKRASVALTFKGRILSDDEENDLINIIIANSDLNIICLVKEDPVTNGVFVQALQAVENLRKNPTDEEWAEHVASDNSLKDLRNPAADAALYSAEIVHEYEIHTGDLQDNTVLDSHQSLLIIGNIDKTSAAASDKSIIIIGKLLGIAEAGRKSDSGNCYVAALDMSPAKLTIGGISAKTGLFGDRKLKGHPDRLKVAYMKDSRIVFTSDLKEIRSIIS